MLEITNEKMQTEKEGNLSSIFWSVAHSLKSLLSSVTKPNLSSTFWSIVNHILSYVTFFPLKTIQFTRLKTQTLGSDGTHIWIQTACYLIVFMLRSTLLSRRTCDGS